MDKQDSQDKFDLKNICDSGSLIFSNFTFSIQKTELDFHPVYPAYPCSFEF